jgi:hypothetical protein
VTALPNIPIERRAKKAARWRVLSVQPGGGGLKTVEVRNKPLPAVNFDWLEHSASGNYSTSVLHDDAHPLSKLVPIPPRAQFSGIIDRALVGKDAENQREIAAIPASLQNSIL